MSNQRNQRNQPYSPASKSKSLSKSSSESRLRLLRIVLVVVVVLVTALVLWFLTNTQTAVKAEGTQPTHVIATESDDAAVDFMQPQQIEDLDYSADVLTMGLEDLPRSLQGTQVDGELIVNSQSELVVTRGLRRLFDYFLSASGEEEDATINARVESYISSRTPEPASSHAIALYYQYLEYLQQVAKIEDKYGRSTDRLVNSKQPAGAIDMTVIAQQQQDIQTLRSNLFNPQTNDAFFSEEEALYRYNLAMLKIAQDSSLTQRQKQQAQQRYIDKLPDSPIKQHAKQQSNIEQLFINTQQMQAEGATQDELFAMRSQRVGKQAAERLAKLDAENADFDARFEQYQQARDKILASKVASQTQQQQIEQLQQKLFTKTEQKRLTGYEQFKQQQAQ